MEIRLVLKKASKGRKVFRLRRPQSVIGRGKGNALRIPSADVSREHCRLVVEENVVTVQDLGSVNGTLLNGVMVEGVQEVHPGDFLRVGPALFQVDFNPGPATPEPEPEFEILDDDPADDSQEVVLEIDSDQPTREESPFADSSQATGNAAQDDSWQLPAKNDLRDLLADLDQAAEAQAPSAKKRKKKK